MTILRTLLALTAAVAATNALAAPAIEKTVKAEPGSLYELVFNPGDQSVYVAAVGPRDAKAARIVRFDAASLTPKGGVDVASSPLYGLAINTRTQTLYGTDTRAGTVSIIDLKAGAVSATVKHAGGKAPHVREVIVDEAANKAYVTIVGGAPEKAAENPNQVWVIDGATRTLERIITVPTDTLTAAAVDSAGKRLFVTGMGGNEIVAIDLVNDQVIGKWPAGGERPTNLVFDAAGKRLFVANQGTGDLSVLNADTGAVLKTVKTGEGALSVAFNPKLNQVYVANRQAGTVTIVDGADYAVLGNLKTGTFPQTLAVDPATNRLFVSNKARGLPRNAPPGTPAPDDPAGDTLTVIRP